METVATRAKVGKPTRYKWWPSKAALIIAMFYERPENEWQQILLVSTVSVALGTFSASSIARLRLGDSNGSPSRDECR
jgi:AcrR family transcriptional regulator